MFIITISNGCFSDINTKTTFSYRIIIVAFLENATIEYSLESVRSYSSTLVQARNLILSMYVHLILIYKIDECRHA